MFKLNINKTSKQRGLQYFIKVRVFCFKAKCPTRRREWLGYVRLYEHSNTAVSLFSQNNNTFLEHICISPITQI